MRFFQHGTPQKVPQWNLFDVNNCNLLYKGSQEVPKKLCKLFFVLFFYDVYCPCDHVRYVIANSKVSSIFENFLRPTCTNFRYLLNHFVAQKLQNCLEFTRLSSIKYFFVSVWGVVRSWFVRHYKDKNFNDHSNFFPQIFPLRDEKVQKFLPNSCIKISPPPPKQGVVW